MKKGAFYYHFPGDFISEVFFESAGDGNMYSKMHFPIIWRQFIAFLLLRSSSFVINHLHHTSHSAFPHGFPFPCSPQTAPCAYFPLSCGYFSPSCECFHHSCEPVECSCAYFCRSCTLFLVSCEGVTSPAAVQRAIQYKGGVKKALSQF